MGDFFSLTRFMYGRETWTDESYEAESDCMRRELGFGLDNRLFSCYHYTTGLRISIKHQSRLTLHSVMTDGVYLMSS